MERYEDIDQESKITVSIWTNDIDVDSILKIALTECDVEKNNYKRKMFGIRFLERRE